MIALYARMFKNIYTEVYKFMKILITGTKGYIAQSFADYYTGETRLINLRDNSWRDISFAGYDAVLHTAGLVHTRETRRNQYDYYIINRDLTLEVANKAKKDGIRQFVFLSSISVYGLTTGIITTNTPTEPTTHYGRSKLAAESMLTALADDTFRVAILRPPMVYGPNCPGNFASLCRLIRKVPVFPDFENARSMVYVGNLCAYIQAVVETGQGGVFFPRDPAPIRTGEMALVIAKAQGKTLRLTRIFNGLIACLIPHISIVSKLFGSLVLDSSLPEGGDVDLISFPDSVRMSIIHLNRPK